MSAVTETHTWLRHPPTDNHWLCPVDAVENWTARGWEPSEAPPEVDVTTAHWPKPAPAPVPAAPAAKKDKSPAKAENEEKIDG